MALEFVTYITIVLLNSFFRRRELLYIETYEQLASFCERATKSDVLAIDTEFMREKTFYPKLCLIQLATRSEIVLVDPLSIPDLTDLCKLFLDKKITKIFHACSQDLELIYDIFSCLPKPVFDTQVAAAFLGHRFQIGYGPLVDALCHVHLPKAESLTDWTRRPLAEEQLEYAADDVRYLPRMYDTLLHELKEKERYAWFLEEMHEVCNEHHVIKKPQEAYLHMRRISSLTRKQLAIAREIGIWRDVIASHKDIPRKWVIPDEIVIDLCKSAPKTMERLERIRSVDTLSIEDKQTLLQAIEKGVACPRELYPTTKRHERASQEMESVVDLMYALVRLQSEKTGVATQLLATRDDLCAFVRGVSDTQLSDSWRFEMIGQKLQALMEGRVGLTVKDGKVELL